MESFMSAEPGIQKFWTKLVGQFNEDDSTADELFENQLLFPPAQVQAEDEVIRKSEPASPSCIPCSLKDVFCECQGSSSQVAQAKDIPGQYEFSSVAGATSLDGRRYGDIPCRYVVPKCESHEMTAVGVCIHSSILTGFSYKIRPLSYNGKTKWLFNGEAREVESIGRGYSRRITLKSVKGRVNSNEDFFWTDSNPNGFAFSIQVLQPQDKFTLFDADHQPVGHLEITALQGSQKEVSQKLHAEGRVEKLVQVSALSKVDWFHELDSSPISPISGVCYCVRESKGSSRLIEVRGVKIGSHHGFTLIPGTCTSLRSLKVFGHGISDVPTSYTIVGIDTHHLPVIGTYIDERILPGFYYRVQLGGCGKKLFGGQALRLDSLGRGYAKRITLASDSPNNPSNHFWSDSHPEGFGFEVSAVRPGMQFVIKTKDNESVLGHAHVFRDDCAPQVELSQTTVMEENGTGILKKIQIDVKCLVVLDLSTKEDLEPHVMRVSGVASLYKAPNQRESQVIKIEDIGLDSQLNILFFNQWKEIVFYPASIDSEDLI